MERRYHRARGLDLSGLEMIDHGVEEFRLQPVILVMRRICDGVGGPLGLGTLIRTPLDDCRCPSRRTGPICQPFQAGEAGDGGLGAIAMVRAAHGRGAFIWQTIPKTRW
jgi:hypothetical protein